MKSWLVTLLISAAFQPCPAETYDVIAPTRGPIGGPADTATLMPFLIKYASLSSMRYQQVFSASVFSNVPPEFIYITSFRFRQDDTQQFSAVWTVTNMQINLSTTSRAVHDLGTNFAENVGTDDTIVFGPGRHDFDDTVSEQFSIFLNRPFIYNPALGNLLLDVRIFNASDPINPSLPIPTMDAQNSATDETSRVWATNVTAAVATGADTIGLDTVVEFSSVPSLVIYTTGTNNTPANYIVIDWPSQPSVFRLQQSSKLGTDAIWQTVTSTTGPRYFFPVESAGSAGFFRLVWESSQTVQPATVPIMRGTTQGLPGVK